MANPAFAALSRRLGGRSGLLTGWVSIPDPLVAGIIAREGVDCVTLDMQHGTVDVACAVQGIAQVLLAGRPALVRVPVGDFATASRMLDCGASGIIAPMVNTVEDARTFARVHEIPAAGRAELGPGHRARPLRAGRCRTICRRPTSSHPPSP